MPIDQNYFSRFEFGQIRALGARISNALGKIAMLLVLASLVSCATVSVKPKPLGLTREGIASAKLIEELIQNPNDVLDAMARASRERLENALQLDRRGQPLDAAAFYLKVAVDAALLLAEPDQDLDGQTGAALLSLHNCAMGRFAEQWAIDPRRGTAESFRLRSEGFTLEIVRSDDNDFPPLLFDRAVASSSLKGKGMMQIQRVGYGAPLVAIREKTPQRKEELAFFPERGMHVAATLVMEEIREFTDAEGARTQVRLSLKNPALRDTITVAGRELPLSANFSANIEMLLTGHNGTLWGLGGFFQADKRAAKSGIRLIEPYDPNRIPVILTHGLASVPIIWKDLIPQLQAEPDIARQYQFMVFSYPSAYSITESAYLFRNELAGLRAKYDPLGRDPLSTNLVGIGHSMGGVLTHVLAADFGDELWRQISDVPLNELGLDAEQEREIRKLVYFDPDPAISRAIFMSTPHGGALMAEASLAVWISRLASLPKEFLATTGALLDDPDISSALKIDTGRNVTSVQSLRPDSPIVQALAVSPYKEGVVYHSIIGDRGKGDSPDSSDGAVEYSSSHQEGAASELIVPTPHSSYAHPKTIAEVKRILRLHLKASGSGPALAVNSGDSAANSASTVLE